MTAHQLLEALRGTEDESGKALHYLLFEARGDFLFRIARILHLDPDEVGFEDAFCEAVFRVKDRIYEFDPAQSSLFSTLIRFTKSLFYTGRKSTSRMKKREARYAGGRGPAIEPDAASETPVINLKSVPEPDRDADADAGLLYQERQEVLDKVLAALGARCQQVLTLWSVRVPYREMAEKHQIKNPNSAVQECREKLNNWLGNNPVVIDYFRP